MYGHYFQVSIIAGNFFNRAAEMKDYPFEIVYFNPEQNIVFVIPYRVDTV
jgi:hypothetical protein